MTTPSVTTATATTNAGSTGATPAPAAAAGTVSAEGVKTPDATTATPAPADGAKPTTTDGKTEANPADPAKATEGTEPELTFKFPDGVAPDETILAAVTPIMKELGLKSEGAQKLVSAYVTAQGESISKHLAKQNEEWIAKAKADPEIGGDKFAKTVEASQRVFKQFGDKEIVDLLDESGFGNHPAFLRLWAKVAKAVGNDNVSGTTGTGASAPRSGDATLIGTMYTHPTSSKYNQE